MKFHSESSDDEEDDGQDDENVLNSEAVKCFKVFIMDGKTEQCWCYSDYSALKNDGTIDVHAKFDFETNWLTSAFQANVKKFFINFNS